jgi:hypothetical protein
MVCGILAHKRTKEERLKRSRSFSISILCSKLSMLYTLPGELILRAAFSFGRLSWRPLSFLWTVFSDTDANRILKLAVAFNY